MIVPTSVQLSNGTYTFVGISQRTYLQADSAGNGVIQISNVGGSATSQCSTNISGYLL